MKEVWQRIEAWFTKNFPGDYYLEGFAPVFFPKGASEEEIRKAEKKLKLGKNLRVRLPEEVRQSYLIHNGCECVPPEYGELLTVDRIPVFWARCLRWADLWKNNDLSLVTISTTGPVKKELWNPQWIPLTDSGGGHCYICVDLDPAEGGQVGQVVYITTDDLLRIVLADGFKNWLSEFAEELEAGHFKWVEEEEAVVRVGGKDIFGRWYRDR